MSDNVLRFIPLGGVGTFGMNCAVLESGDEMFVKEFYSIGGGFIGGILSIRYGVMRILFLGAILAAATNVLFAYLAGQGPDVV